MQQLELNTVNFDSNLHPAQHLTTGLSENNLQRFQRNRHQPAVPRPTKCQMTQENFIYVFSFDNLFLQAEFQKYL
jgi:hypothetical protein